QAQTGFQGIARAREMDAVVDNFVPDEAADHPEEEENRRVKPGKNNQRKGYCQKRKPGAGGEDGVRVAMMDVVKGAYEGLEKMTQRTVDNVFEQCPDPHSPHPQNRAPQHAFRVSRRGAGRKCSQSTARRCIRKIAAMGRETARALTILQY